MKSSSMLFSIVVVLFVLQTLILDVQSTLQADFINAPGPKFASF
jgi:hypothetical protein